METSADRAAGAAIEIPIDGEAYQLFPLKARDFADIKGRLRGEALASISNCSDIDPIGKRHAWALAADKPIDLHEMLRGMSSPDVAAWVVWNQLRKRGAKVPLSQIEDFLPIELLIDLVLAISGLADTTEDDKKKLQERIIASLPK